MKRFMATTLAFIALATTHLAVAQPSDNPAELVSSWVLVALERNIDAGESTRAQAPRGLLVIDAAGNVFEFFSSTGREELEGPQRTLANFGGFWGSYQVGGAPGQIDFTAADGVSPNVQGLEFSRSYELEGDRLTMTSMDEPQAQGHNRWIWQRMPTVENLSPAYRQVVGFWQHVEESQVNEATGEVLRTSERAPSVIVYTPGGFVGVHFPSLGRETFSGDTPTAAEAQAGLRGYIGYFGTLGVYPGEVTHNILSGVSPTTGSILRRYADINGDELVVRLQATGAQPQDDRPRNVTTVTLRRLSGADDMLPRQRGWQLRCQLSGFIGRQRRRLAAKGERLRPSCVSDTHARKP